MEGTYKRMFLRWEILRGLVPAVIFAAVAVAIEILFFNYMTGHGFVDQQIMIPLASLNLPISIALLFSLGNSVVILTLWMSVFENTAYVMTSPDRRVRRILYPLRMVRGAALVLAPFSIVLFTPYIIESSWFISIVVSFVSAIPFFKQTAVSFYTWSYGVSKTDPFSEFLASQLSATLVTVVVGGLQLWRVKGARNLRLLLRRRR